MKQLTIYSSLIAIYLLLQMPTAFAQMGEDWKQFRGPSRSGISIESISDNKINDPAPELIWKKK